MSNKRGEKKLDHPSAGDLMTPKIYMLKKDQTFKELIEMMDSKVISAVVIHDEETDEYFFISHSDIIRFLRINKCQFKDLKSEPLHGLITRKIAFIDKEESIDNVIIEMNDNGHKRVLVTDKGKPVGVLTLKDINKWSSVYFQKANPLVVLIVSNQSGVCLSKYICSNVNMEKVNSDLIELFGSAITSVSSITEEVFKEASGAMRIVRKDKYTIIFSQMEEITGILICDNNSIDLRRKLDKITELFYIKYETYIKSEQFKRGYFEEQDISDLCSILEIGKCN